MGCILGRVVITAHPPVNGIENCVFRFLNILGPNVDVWGQEKRSDLWWVKIFVDFPKNLLSLLSQIFFSVLKHAV